MLEFGGEKALEVVLDDEDAEKVWVAAGAKDVPRECGEAKSDNSGGVKQAKSVAPAFCDECPEEDGATAKDDRGRSFCEYREAEEEAEEDGGKGG